MSQVQGDKPRGSDPPQSPQQTTQMDLTIIIVNWNGGDFLNRCLQSIRNSKTSFKVHAIVVDNDSSDGSRESAQQAFPEDHIFNSGYNLGFGKANNLARPLVQTPLVLFLNPDTELEESTLAKCVETLERLKDVGAIGCKMRYKSGEVHQQGLQWFPTPFTIFVELLFLTRNCRRLFQRWLPIIDAEQSSYVAKLYGGYIMARKEVLDAAGWFDERYFMYAEDSDLSKTITASGWKLYYRADAQIFHSSGGSTVAAPSGFSTLMRQQSMNQMIRKYQGPIGGFMHRIALIAGALVRLIVAVALWIFMLPFPNDRRKRLSGTIQELRLMILWALGMRKAIPAGNLPAGGT